MGRLVGEGSDLEAGHTDPELMERVEDFRIGF